jgi:hypothetical protein
MTERKRHEELVVITKTYNLILRSRHHTGKFPHNHRFVPGERIERNQYDLLETLIRAKCSRSRRVLLERPRLFSPAHGPVADAEVGADPGREVRRDVEHRERRAH